MQDGFWLPSLMFSEHELEAIVLGMRWAAKQTDSEMQQYAKSALGKIRSALPNALEEQVLNNTLMVAPPHKNETAVVNRDILIPLRQSIREEKVIRFQYLSLNQETTSRQVWPFALGYFESVSVLAAWCETRQAIRHFRTDRISQLIIEDKRYPVSKKILTANWKKENGIEEV